MCSQYNLGLLYISKPRTRANIEEKAVSHKSVRCTCTFSAASVLTAVMDRAHDSIGTMASTSGTYCADQWSFFSGLLSSE